MTIDLSIIELSPPRLQFGGASAHSDPKAGLVAAGPFDLRFGSARKDHVHVGIIGPAHQVAAARSWLDRCGHEISVFGEPSLLRKPFPGFAETFHKRLVAPDISSIDLTSGANDDLAHALYGDAYQAFQRVVDLYADAHARLASRDLNRPDVVLMCIPENVFDKVGSVERTTTEEERKRAKAIRRARETTQLDLFDILEEVEQTPEDFLKRDLRHALKARALRKRLPIQLVTDALLNETARNQDPASRAWNFAVGLYYKAGGVPWRLRRPGRTPVSLASASTIFERHTALSSARAWRRRFPATARASQSEERGSQSSPIRVGMSTFRSSRRSNWHGVSWRSMNSVLAERLCAWCCIKPPISIRPNKRASPLR